MTAATETLKQRSLCGHSSLERTSFDRIAPFYQTLEWFAFGHALQLARVAFIEKARRAERVLLVGEGAGRFLERLARINRLASIDVVDASAAMLRLARRRAVSQRIRFHHADFVEWTPQLDGFDLIATHFFLDCFDSARLALVVGKITTLATPNARWLISDFHLPRSGIAHTHARIWLKTMYAFFGRTTGLPVRELAPFAPLLRELGWARHDRRDFRLRLISAQLWERSR